MALLAKKHPMPMQDASLRIQNFSEVALGYTAEIAREEASRCLNCKKKPCVSGCPVGIDIPGFIDEIKKNNYEKAYQIISESSTLPAVCGRVCPQERQCESKCTMGIKFEPVGIGRLERFIADWHNENSAEAPTPVPQNGHRVAVIGSGPSGLTCAGELAKRGYAVTVFEALHNAGGVLIYGIPEFRLPKRIVAKEVDNLRGLGVSIETNVVIGKTLTVDDLFSRGYEAIFIGSGAGLPKFMGIPGETLRGVFSANEYLTRINLMKAAQPDSRTPIFRGRRVAVVGGGNVAMDAARCARRMGAEVSVIYRRSEAELPARKEEVEHAMEEGIEFRFLTNPLEMKGDENGNVAAMVCQKMKLTEPDASGRRKAVAIHGSKFTLETDCVIMSLGTSPNPLLRNTTKDLATDTNGCVIVTEDGLTSREAVYAGGDAATGAATVILAMGSGKKAAIAIDRQLQGSRENRE